MSLVIVLNNSKNYSEFNLAGWFIGNPGHWSNTFFSNVEDGQVLVDFASNHSSYIHFYDVPDYEVDVFYENYGETEEPKHFEITVEQYNELYKKSEYNEDILNPCFGINEVR